MADPDDRELVISCGAALFHLRVALRHFGFRGDVQTVAPSARFDALGLRTVPDVLARVRLGRSEPPSPEDEALFAAIPRRHTNRSRFLDEEVGGAVLDALRHAALEEGAWLSYVDTPADRAGLADLIADADRVQAGDPAFRAELASWLRVGRPAAGDGMPGYSMGQHGIGPDVDPTPRRPHAAVLEMGGVLEIGGAP
ncbi:MAG: hypothetical protein MJB57_14680 [Gemmatimonadetes bacterium]|nr:hypothetical protein [Gemmatimonadota bacterium]